MIMFIHAPANIVRLSFREWRLLNPADYGGMTCPNCGGSGTIEPNDLDDEGQRFCWRCHGSGELNDEAAASAIYDRECDREDELIAQLNRCAQR